jgi:cob(I)alamin adenosyltransferase
MTPDYEEIFKEEFNKITQTTDELADQMSFVWVHTKNLYKSLKDIQAKLLKIPIELQSNPKQGLEELKEIISQIQKLLESSEEVTNSIIESYQNVSKIKEH